MSEGKEENSDKIKAQEGWIQLQDKYYKKQQLYAMDKLFQNLDLEHSFLAVAKYGGPIAVFRNQDKLCIIGNDAIKDKIVFYSNQGTEISSVKFTYTEKIVEFNFIEDELLLIVLSSGLYYLINPSLSPNKLPRIPQQKELDQQFLQNKIQDAKVVQNGFVFISNYQFYCIQDVYEPKVQEFYKTDLTKQLPVWVVVPANPLESGKIEVFYSHHQQGIVQIIENERKTLLYGSGDNKKDQQQQQQNQQLEIKNIKFLQFSSNYKYLAILTKNQQKWQVIVTDLQKTTKITTIDFQEELQAQLQYEKQQEQEKSQQQQQQLVQNIDEKKTEILPLQMLWCDLCVVIVMKRSLYLVGPDKSERMPLKKKSKFAFCIQELDGIRIIQNLTNELLRMLPDSCVNIFKMFSKEPSAKLFDAYLSFLSQNPQEDEDLRNKKDQLALAVQECTIAGSFECGDLQQKLLKAASYGKTFINDSQFEHTQLFEVCKYLRVIKALQNEAMKRELTYYQLKHMSEEQIIKILLTYNLHHLGFEICKHLSYPDKLKQQIFVHWACCKVESKEDDNTICQKIIEKLRNERGIPYTKIAHKAIESGKPDLAIKLLYQEPIISKRVPELLQMAAFQDPKDEFNFYLEKALEEAVKSYDSDLINQVILAILNSQYKEEYMHRIISKFPSTLNHFVNYLRNFDLDKLQTFLTSQKYFLDAGLFTVKQASSYYATLEEMKFRQKLFEQAIKIFKIDYTDPQMCKLVDSEFQNIQSYNHIRQTNDKNQQQLNRSYDQISIYKLIEEQLLNNNTSKVKEIQKDNNIQDRTMHILRCKTLIQMKYFDELENYLSEINKKKEIIPYDVIAQQLQIANQMDQAVKFITKMSDFDESIFILMRIQRYKEAAQHCVQKKEFKKLFEIREKISDQDVLTYIDKSLQTQVKK